jgi:hypothetical protein
VSIKLDEISDLLNYRILPLLPDGELRAEVVDAIIHLDGTEYYEG